MNTSDEIELYWVSGSGPCWSVMLALAYLDVQYRSVLLDSSKKELKDPEFLSLNPRGLVPVLRHRGFVVRESLAIIAYLDKAWPKATTMFGAGPSEVARVWQRALEGTNHLRPAVQAVVQPIFRKRVDASGLDEQLQRLDVELQRLEDDLDGPYLELDRPTAADFVVYPNIGRLRRGISQATERAVSARLEEQLRRRPRILAFEQAIQNLPRYADTFPAHWRG